MADPLIVPTSPDDPFYEQQSTIDGIDYTLTFRYNQREETFYLSVGDVAGNDLVKGVKLVCGWDLFLGHKHPDMPEGRFMVLSHVTGDSESPKLGELGEGRRCLLYYFPFDQAEEDALEAKLAAARIL